MTSNVTISDGSRTVNGWIVKNLKESVSSDSLNMSLPLMDSSNALIFDFNGRTKRITITGVLVEGETLGTGTGMSVTTLGAQIDALNTYFFNTSGGVSITLVRPNQSNITCAPISLDVIREGPNMVEFTANLMEGTVF